MLTCLNLGYGGRIGNQAFQIAGVIGLAKKFGHDFAFPYWMNFEHRDKFGSTEDIDIQSWFKNKLPVTSRREGFHDVNIEFNTSPDHFVLPGTQDNYINITQQYSGHLQSEKWFAHCADLIRHYFEFDEEKMALHIGDVEPLKKDVSKFSAIHMRFGDYDNPDSWQPVLNENYYAEAISRLPQHTRFLVFSDNIVRATEEVKKLNKVYPFESITVVGAAHYMVHLYFMSICSNFIIGNSTFSWWGAWLSKNPDKKVVAPSTWWKPHIEAQWGYSTRDLFPENWIVI